MIGFLLKGGPVMIPLAVLSIISLALIIERIVYFARTREHTEDLLIRIAEGSVALEELEGANTPEAKVLLAGLLARREGQSQEAIGRRMESQALKSAAELERNISFLSIIANLATLLGLLGTVTGMLRAFLNLRVSGIADPARLAGGISEALITTVAGLIIAIPSLFCFHIFRGRVNRSLARMEMSSSELLSLFAREKQQRIKLQ